MSRPKSVATKTTRTQPEPVAPQPAAPTRSRSKTLAAVAAIAAVVAAYTVAVMMLPVATDSLTLVSLMAVPAVVTMVFVPQARSTGLYRWPVAWFIGFTSLYPLPMLIAAQTWVVARFWLVDGTPRWPRRAKDDTPHT